jgi:demethoxyubiquinone hydroxylase (CLK1/Coq7/Cat5 family)
MNEEKRDFKTNEIGHDLHLEHEDATIRILHRIIRVAVKLLAVIMVMVIVWGIADVVYVLYQ